MPEYPKYSPRFQPRGRPPETPPSHPLRQCPLSCPGFVRPPSESSNNPISAYTCEEVASFRSIREAVLSKTWERVREAEARGKQVPLKEFGAMMKMEWSRAKAAAATCPIGAPVAAEI